MRPETIQIQTATFDSVVEHPTATPTSAVQHAMNLTRCILDESLDDTIRLSQQHRNEAEGDDASMDQELNDLATWQDCIQSDLLQLDVSWSQEQGHSQSTWSDELDDAIESGSHNWVKPKLVAMNIDDGSVQSVRRPFPARLLELIFHLAFQATGSDSYRT